MTPADILDRAADYVERGWCTDVLARDAKGDYCDPRDARAVRWCVSGALHAAHNCTLGLAYETRDVLSAFVGHCSLTTWNDALPPGSGPIVAAKMRAAAQQWREENGR